MSLEFLARAPLFEGLTAAELDELGSGMRPVLLEPGQEIPNVVESTTTDEIMRSVGETLPRVD